MQEMESEIEFPLELQDLTRRKLARELHDGLTQAVAALAMRVNYARRLMDTDLEGSEQELLKVENLARTITKEIRHMIFTLRPVRIESQGLLVALESLAEKMSELYDLDINLTIDLVVPDALGVNSQQVIYSIVEEAIDNSRKYTQADHIWVRITENADEIVRLEIKDDGKAEDQLMESTQNQELDSILDLARLVGGKVEINLLDGKSLIIQVLIPSIKPTSKGTLPRG